MANSSSGDDYESESSETPIDFRGLDGKRKRLVESDGEDIGSKENELERDEERRKR